MFFTSQIPDNWPCQINPDGRFYFRHSPKWSSTSPLSGSACLALRSNEGDFMLEVICVEREPGGDIIATELRDSLRDSLQSTFNNFKIRFDNAFPLKRVTDRVLEQAVMPMEVLCLGKPIRCQRLTMNYTDNLKCTQDTFILTSGTQGIYLNFKAFSWKYSRVRKLCELTARSLKMR